MIATIATSMRVGCALVVTIALAIGSTALGAAAGRTAALKEPLQRGTHCNGARRRSAAEVADVPSALPDRGVYVDEQFVLCRQAMRTEFIGEAEALSDAHKYFEADDPVKALLARLTVPGTIPPPDSTIRYDTIRDEPVWVLTFTAAKAVNVSQASQPVFARHFTVALNAQTGAFLRGFDTR
jgi:hypothetical protein